MNISVCMAAYNGERFIHEQLTSILAQLSSEDEIVIVDDASSDETVAIAESFCDGRIRILQQGRNHGVIKTFGHALEEAKGEIIFLADQDDIWRMDKVVKINGMFSACPDISLVISNCSIIDADGNITSESWCKSGSFQAGALHNLVRNRYRGCQMAFRRSILGYCLPFPPDIPMHDMWIGIVNQFVGRTGFIDEPLVFYRRHDQNKSPEKHAPIVQMIRWRWALVKNLVLLYAHRLALGRTSVTIRNR